MIHAHCDIHGLPLSGAQPEAVTHYDQALAEFRCLRGDPLAAVERAIALAPNMPMAHVLKAWLNLIGTEPAGVPAAREALDTARILPASEHERAHLAAASALAEGRWQRAGLLLEDLSAAAPQDLLALQLGHQIDFFRGDSRMLRDRIARALPAWDGPRPGKHALLGMYAFGLEECGDYAAAERFGREAVEREPRDGWAWHAVAHVHEMRGEARRGIDWLHPSRAVWSEGSFLAPHNTWHLALFHLTEGDSAAALRLYDEAIGGEANTAVMDLVDASAMLWRLRLLGIEAGERWQSLADRWQATAGAGLYAFNDIHAMLALLGAGRDEGARQVREALHAAQAGDADNAQFSREVGIHVADALLARRGGRPEQAVALLRGVRNRAQRFGGSHAQRDLIDLTLLDALAQSGDDALLAAFVAEREAARPGRPLMPASVRRRHRLAARAA